MAEVAEAPAEAPASNPLSEGLQEYRVIDPTLMVIFGATGDLANRKLLPAIYNLALQRILPAGFSVVGVARDDRSDAAFRKLVGDSIRLHSRTQPVNESVLKSLIEGMRYQQLNFDDTAGFKKLDRFLDEVAVERHTGGNRIYYCATPPPTFPLIVRNLGATGMAREPKGSARRILIEKPFGTDLKSARALNQELETVFHEDQVFRIDHYLGKETVQNIVAFRFANSIFEPVWNNQYVDSVQITVAEELGVEGRGGYYEGAGELRDIVQNHELQLLTLVAMEPPVNFDQGAVRDEKVKVLKAVCPIVGEEVDRNAVRGQYGPGWVLGHKTLGYRQEKSVDQHSRTETFAALKLVIDNWRWAGVPFFIRAGKRLPKRSTTIRVQFKRPPHLTFGRQAMREAEPNAITLHIQPEEGISLRFAAKVPSAGILMRSVNMDFLYASSFLTEAPDAYERLLADCMVGDATLFTRKDEVEAAWSIIDPIEERWAEKRVRFPNYAAGSWGPAAADELIEQAGFHWYKP
ncbi:MAG TPA: glucose-6-phosphate dehydrogenase [Candidatus Dormibacteraeota bacterium]|jgi:glucose-6-phosphate 1-dehydrogenase